MILNIRLHNEDLRGLKNLIRLLKIKGIITINNMIFMHSVEVKKVFLFRSLCRF